jgi:hypothetical protein
MDQYRVELLDELHKFKSEYDALMYGGVISTVVSLNCISSLYLPVTRSIPKD